MTTQPTTPTPLGYPSPGATSSGLTAPGLMPPVPPPAQRPPVPWWAALLSVLGVLVVLGVLSTAVAAVVVESATRTVRVPVEETGVRTLRIEGVTGGVRLRTDDAVAGTVSGTTRVTTSWQEAEVEAVRDGDELVLRATCPDQGWPRRCEVGHDLLVDPDVDVVVDIVTGGLQAQGLAGDVDVSVTAGGVLLEDLTSQVVRVDVTTGGVVMGFAVPPREVGVTATTGGIDIGLPADGAAYAVRTSVSVGDAGVSVPVDDDAGRSITASTTVGGIGIHTGDQAGQDLGSGLRDGTPGPGSQ